MADERTEDILRKYGSRIEGQIKSDNLGNVDYSREYVTFKEEMARNLTRYEKWCRTLGNLIRVKVSEKDKTQVEKYLKIAHVDATPEQALTLSIVSFVGLFLAGLLISVSYMLISNSFPLLFFFLVVIFSIFVFYFTRGFPRRLANTWRLKASSQMVPAVLYVVVYMRHTPNFEKAIAFASEHLEYPLALDFKKVFYDVQVGKFSTIKESLDNYLEVWRDYNVEFIESFHLIESSLFEPDNARRITILEKSLQVVLEGVYDKMLKFTHEVKSPLTNVYMLGIVLPTLGLALLPLATAMLQGAVQWFHVFILFNLIVPFFVFYLTDKVLSERPGGHGEVRLLERNPYYREYISKTPYLKAFLICLPFFILGFLPLIFQYTPVTELIGLQKDYTFTQLGISFLGDEKIFDFIPKGNGYAGPFGVVALILSLFIPLGLALFFSLSFGARTKKLIIERENTDKLESEFNSSLFQLGNRLGNGVPPELAFGKVAESTKGLKTEDFFKRVDFNIKQNGMSVESSIFDPRRGALVYYPSGLISTSMRILIESAKKGLKIAALSLMSISEYVKNIQKITQRLKDMLAEISSDMKSNMVFLAPLLSGVVIGLSMMIASILNKIVIPSSGDLAGLGGYGGILDIFSRVDMVPPYFLQIIVGVYLVQIVFILTSTLVAVDSGEDKLKKTNQIGKNLVKGITLYFVTALVSILALFILASIVLSGTFS